jgi:RNA polymerase sigma-70 factor (ECF subfamily)
MRDFSGHDTDELLSLVAAGDAGAADSIFDRCRPRLKAMIARRMDSRLAQRVDPSDVVQECLAVAHVKLPEYLDQRPISFYPWLRAIAWDRLVDLHRRHVTSLRRSVEREVPLDACLSHESATWLAQELVASGTGPLQRIARREMADRVREAMERLSPALSEALLLRYLEQLSAREGAEVLGITEAAYKQRLVRALRQLRVLLADESESEA